MSRFTTRNLSIPALAASLFFALPAPSRAALSYYVSIDGNAETRLATNAGLVDDKPTLSTGQLPQTSVSQSKSSSQDGVDGINPPVYNEHADATVNATSTIGALHATVSATATTSPNWGPGASLGAGTLNLEWFDTVTFHTPNPAGADFTASLSLDDSITPTPLTPSGYRSAGGVANAILDINGGTYANIYDAVSLGSTPQHPASYTHLVPLHVTDGQTTTFRVRLQINGTAEDDASVDVDAADTALFQLYSPDPTASYTTASGVTFVPEPTSLLATCGLALPLLRRRKNRT